MKQVYKTVEEIIEGYNETAERQEEYERSEDSAHAEYCASFSYGELRGEDLIKDADLEDETKDALKTYLKTHGNSDLQDLLAKHSVLELVGIHIVANELCSITIGEVECEPPNDLLEAYLNLTPEDRGRVRRECDAYISDSVCAGYLYINMDYERWVLVCDEDALKQELNVN